MSEHILYLMPAPHNLGKIGELAPDEAADWLRERAEGYTQLVCDCLLSCHENVRTAAEWLLMDIATMCKACGEAIEDQKNVPVRRLSRDESIDHGTLADAAAILASVETAQGQESRTRFAMADLALELHRQLKEDGAGQADAR